MSRDLVVACPTCESRRWVIEALTVPLSYLAWALLLVFALLQLPNGLGADVPVQAEATPGPTITPAAGSGRSFPIETNLSGPTDGNTWTRYLDYSDRLWWPPTRRLADVERRLDALERKVGR